MASFNRVVLMGNLTRDIELRYTQSGLAVTDVGLAVNERRKTPSGEMVDETLFVDATLWGRTAEIASEYLGKGSLVLIEGRLKLDQWEQDGQKRSRIKVVGERLQMMPKGTGGGGGNRPPPMTYDESEYSGPVRREAGRAAGSGGGAGSAPVAAGNGGPTQPEEDIPF